MGTLIPDSQEVPTTLQGFFDIAWKWMHRPEAKLCKSLRTGACYNRNKANTNACIIGAAFPDSLIPPERNSIPVDCLIGILGVSKDFKFLDKLRYKLMDLQICHDKAENVQDCIELLKDFAIDYSLTIPKLS